MKHDQMIRLEDIIKSLHSALSFCLSYPDNLSALLDGVQYTLSTVDITGCNIKKTPDCLSRSSFDCDGARLQLIIWQYSKLHQTFSTPTSPFREDINYFTYLVYLVYFPSEEGKYKAP